MDRRAPACPVLRFLYGPNQSPEPLRRRLLCLFVEMSGEDYYLRPGETFVLEDPRATEDEPIELGPYGQGDLTVYVRDTFGFSVFDETGAKLECGHQRELRAQA